MIDVRNIFKRRKKGGGGGGGALINKLVTSLWGEPVSGDLQQANALAYMLTDEPTEQVWSGERTTADGESIKDGVAFVSTLKGKTLKVNQMMSIDDLVPYSTALVSKSVTDGVLRMEVKNVQTGVKAVQSSNIKFLPIGHKCLIVTKALAHTSSANVSAFVGWAKSNNAAIFDSRELIVKDKFALAYSMFTITSEAVRVELRLSNAAAVGDYIEAKDIMFFDLTDIYGSGNEPTTPDDFAQRFGYASINDLPYIPYQDTNLQSSAPKAIVSKGRNLFNKDATWTSAGRYILNDSGVQVADSTSSYWFEFIKVKPSTEYRIFGGWNINGFQRIYFYNGDTFLSRTPAVNRNTKIVTPSNCDRIRIQYTFTYLNVDSFCLVETTEQVTEFIPYMDSRLSFDLSSILYEGEPLFPNGLKSAGGVYDEVDFVDNVAFKRISDNVGADGNYEELDEPIVVDIAPMKAYYPVENNGIEEAVMDNEIPIYAEIRYRGMDAAELVETIMEML